ncbi:MAG: hypothetical protein K0Q97_2352, partial [Bacillota bacterium]|nr:hypothetical protein [Bacillota bacterium]
AYNMVPLATQGFAWIVPTIVFGIIGGILLKDKDTKNA